MVDSELFSQSVLFGAEMALPSNQPNESAELPDFSSSILFTGADPLPPTNASLVSESVHQQPEKAGKSVRLLDGSMLQLQPRKKKEVVVDFGDDPDAILNMDKLYQRVNERQELRKSQRSIERLAKEPKPDSPRSNQLWAEKYKPRSFLQICPAGNERQYRLVMHWLRKWGTTVFGNPKTDEETVDHLGRPLRKILLVHGPPGVGKTAVVHLLAQQMGYNVEELNAANSMDTMHGTDPAEGATRFANATAALKLKVQNALTTNTITSKGKPTCLVIDEVDSAINNGDIVKVLSELVHADQQTQRNATQGVKKESKKKPFVLNRPIICIANDIYARTSRGPGASPMEKLRALSEIVPFKKPATGFEQGVRINATAQKSVKEYLFEISSKENLNLDRKEISEVYEVCDGDIRACINYLQFSSRKLDSDIYGAPEGMSINKDSSLTWFALVDKIFKRDQRLSKEENFEIMLDVVSGGEGKSAASGSLDKVIRGCFNKYLDVVSLQDDSLVRPGMISDWLYYYDTLTVHGSSSSFYPTLTALKFWSLFSDINFQKFNNNEGLIPNVKNLEFESFESMKRNQATIKTIADSVPLESRVSFGGQSAGGDFYSCELIPFLDRILSPEVGSSRSKTSLSPHEASQIKKLAGLVTSFKISLESQRDMVTNQTYLLYGPDWEGITLFANDQKLEQKKKLLNNKRRWLFPLLQAEFDALIASKLLKRQRSETPEGDSKEAKQKKARMTSSLDYFKNQYDEMSSKGELVPKAMDKETTRVWVKYHEGFSNAVRKNIGWVELWDQQS